MGGDPTLLALGLLVLGLAFLPRLEEKMSLSMWCVCALFVAASVFTHLIPVIGLCYAMFPVGADAAGSRARTWALRQRVHETALTFSPTPVGLSAVTPRSVCIHRGHTGSRRA